MRKDIEHYELWLRFQSEKNSTKKKEIEKKLVEIYYPLVQKIAYSMAEKMNWKIYPDELASFGVDGLYIAINRYSLDRGASFPTYANRRIKGSMIDGMRKTDIIPRSVRINHSNIEKTRSVLESEKGGKVRDEEILEKLGINKTEYVKNTKKYHPISFSSIDGSDNSFNNEENIKKDSNPYLVDERTSSAESKVIRKEFFNKLMGTCFSRVEQKIIYLYYYQDLTMDKIAHILKLSESRVSQIHKDVLPRLQDKIQRNPEYFADDIFSIITSCNDKKNLF